MRQAGASRMLVVAREPYFEKMRPYTLMSPMSNPYSRPIAKRPPRLAARIPERLDRAAGL